MTDLTLVVTAHAETVVAGPTMRSADAAVAHARAQGLSVETIVALDAATPATTAYFAQPAFDHWERRTYAEGDLGRVRNAVLPDTAGRHVAFLDADDLFGENWLAAAVALLREGEERGERWIAHPELNVFFDAARSVLVNVDQDAPLFTPYFLYVRNLYDALCVAPREAYLETPYGAVDLPHGVGFEDWQFAVESMAAGWRHKVVPDTVIFKRRRDDSLVVTSSARHAVLRSLPALAIDRVGDLGRPDPQ